MSDSDKSSYHSDDNSNRSDGSDGSDGGKQQTLSFNDVVTSLMQYVDGENQRAFAAIHKSIGKYLQDLNKRVTVLEGEAKKSKSAPPSTVPPKGFFDYQDNYPKNTK